MNNNIQCSIESSTTSMELNSAADGIYLVPELEGLAGLPEIRTTSGVNAGYDGGWTSAQNYDARLIAIRGVIASRDVAQVEAQRRKLASLLGQGRKEQLTLHFTTEAGNSYAINVRTISCEMALQRVLNKQDFLIQLRADDPLIYDDGTSGGIEAILRVRQALGGFQINFNLPLEIGGGSDTTDVENGQETVYPIISLYGPLHSPTVVNMTTNQQMQVIADLGYTISWSGLVNASGEYFSITNSLDKEAPMSLARIYGNATQTTYSGKNLCDSSIENFSTYYASIIETDGALKMIANAGVSARVLLALPELTGGTTYTISFEVRGVSIADGGTFVRVREGSDGGSWISGRVNVSVSSSFTTGTIVFTPSSTVSPFLWFYLSPATTNTTNVEIYVKNIQLEVGNTATSYEPYVGGIPAPNPQFPMPINTVTGRQTVEVRGKNLFDVSSPAKSATRSGITITIADDGLITIDGTATASLYPDFVWGVDANTTAHQECYQYYGQALQLTASVKIVGGTTTSTQGIRFYFNDGGASQITAPISAPYSATVNSAYGLNRVWLFIPNGAVYNNFKFYLQLEEGDQASAYEPYQGRIYKINLGGTNLLPSTGTTPTGGTGVSFTKNDDGTYTINGTASSGGFLEIGTIDFKQGQTYTISGLTGWTASTLQLFTISNTAFPIGHRLASYNGATTQTALDNETCAVRLYVYQDVTYNNVVVKPQVQLGSKATPYAPYTTYAYELAKIGTYQDRIYKENGKWYIEKNVGKVVLDGTEDGWSWADTTRYTITTANIGAREAISDHFTYQNYTGASTTTAPSFDVSSNLASIGFYSDTITSLNNFKTWLASNPTAVYYALATPTTTEITNEEVLEGLEAAVGTLGIGENNVFSITPGGNATPTLTISYATRYTEQRDTIVIDSQARTITLNGIDAYHLKTDESEFPVLAPGTNEMYLTSAAVSDSGYAEVKFKQGHLSI